MGDGAHGTLGGHSGIIPNGNSEWEASRNVNEQKHSLQYKGADQGTRGAALNCTPFRTARRGWLKRKKYREEHGRSRSFQTPL